MALYTPLEAAGYSAVVQTDTIVSWDQAERMAGHGAPIVTSALFYAKKSGRCYKVSLRRTYKNRTSRVLQSSALSSEEEVPLEEYDAAVTRGGGRWHRPF